MRKVYKKPQTNKQQQQQQNDCWSAFTRLESFHPVYFLFFFYQLFLVWVKCFALTCHLWHDLVWHYTLSIYCFATHCTTHQLPFSVLCWLAAAFRWNTTTNYVGVATRGVNSMLLFHCDHLFYCFKISAYTEHRSKATN